MNYISKIIINNFQSHKYSEIELDQGLNVIVGPSDQGKSAIIRAVKWVLFNEPLGTFFIREGEKECSVTLQFSGGEKLTRIKSSNKNLYIYVDKNNKESIYEGFGSNVPQPIIDSIGIKKIYLDGKQSSLINIGEQLEGPFLLSEKTSTRANAIGRLIGVHIVDQAISTVVKDIRNLNIRKKNSEDKLIKYKEQLKQFEYLDEMKQTINSIEVIKSKIYITSEKYSELLNLRNEYEKIEKDINSNRIIINKLSYIEDISLLYKHIDIKMKKYRYFNNIYIKYSKLEADISYNSDTINNLTNIETIIGVIKQLEMKTKHKDKLCKIKLRYNRIIKSQSENLYILEKLKFTDKINKDINKISSINIKFQNLIAANNKLKNINKRINIGNYYVENLKNIDEVNKYSNYIQNLLNKLEKMKQYRKEFYRCEKEIIKLQNTINILREKIDKYLDEYKNILSILEICPLCFSKLDKSHIDKIISNYK